MRRELRGRDRKWTESDRTNESGQGGDHKKTALRSRQFAKKGVILRHSNQESGTKLHFSSASLRLKVRTSYEPRRGAVSFFVALARTGYWRQFGEMGHPREAGVVNPEGPEGDANWERREDRQC